MICKKFSTQKKSTVNTTTSIKMNNTWKQSLILNVNYKYVAT